MVRLIYFGAPHMVGKEKYIIGAIPIPAYHIFFKIERRKIMPRVPQVTRTIQTTKVTVLCLDIETGETFNDYLVLPRTYKDEKAMLKQVEEVVNTDTVRAVHIVDSEVQKIRYGMSDQEFIKHAKVLDEELSEE